MSSKFTRTLKVQYYLIILVVLTIGVLSTAFWFWFSSDEKVAAILGGLCTGLIVALVEFCLQWYEHKEIQLIKRLGITKIMSYRDDKAYYEKLIAGSKNEIWVLGTTASRFLDDFASATRKDCRALYEALGRTVKVRILVPKAQYLNEQDRLRLLPALERMKTIQTQHPDAFQCRMFDHTANHSIVRIDEHCLVGPIFPDVPSKDSPVVHANFSSPLVAEYLKYFESEWKLANEI